MYSSTTRSIGIAVGIDLVVWVRQGHESIESACPPPLPRPMHMYVSVGRSAPVTDKREAALLVCSLPARRLDYIFRYFVCSCQIYKSSRHHTYSSAVNREACFVAGSGKYGMAGVTSLAAFPPLSVERNSRDAYTYMYMHTQALEKKQDALIAKMRALNGRQEDLTALVKQEIKRVCVSVSLRGESPRFICCCPCFCCLLLLLLLL